MLVLVEITGEPQQAFLERQILYFLKRAREELPFFLVAVLC